jgi:hypothetical protein
MDGDGDSDLVVAEPLGDTVSVLLNRGDATFVQALTFIAAQDPVSLELFDLEGDGDLDVAAAGNSFPTTLQIFENLGGGVLASPTVHVYSGGYAHDLAAGDIDDDGDTDVIIVSGLVDRIEIFTNDGSGNLTQGAGLDVAKQPSGLELVDLDRDGNLDLVVAATASGQLVILLGDGAGSFTEDSRLAVGGTPVEVRAGRLDGDASLDLCTAAGFTPSVFFVFQSLCGAGMSYCTAKTNSCGSVPAIGAVGVSSASAASGFSIGATHANAGKLGILLYTGGGRAAVPFQGGWLCLDSPIRRAPAQSSVGTGGCSGYFTLDMNAFAAGVAGGNPQPYLSLPGQLVQCQWWGRDTPAHGSYLSDAWQYEVGD